MYSIPLPSTPEPWPQAAGASSIVWDGKLAAYLLDASASHYLLTTLATSYHARSAFSCEEYPDAGFLADLFARMKAEMH